VGALDIVLIEDNEDVVDTMVDWLEDLGHRVRVARSGEAGVELVQAAPPRVVLCDLGLPGMDGTDVCRSIRALALRVQPVMIALTGWGRDGDLRRTKEAGFDHHLVKPISPDKLNEMLQELA
jgi:CheY-like chemotaxis protein